MNPSDILDQFLTIIRQQGGDIVEGEEGWDGRREIGRESPEGMSGWGLGLTMMEEDAEEDWAVADGSSSGEMDDGEGEKVWQNPCTCCQAT